MQPVFLFIFLSADVLTRCIGTGAGIFPYVDLLGLAKEGGDIDYGWNM